jgi:hypothetical protein
VLPAKDLGSNLSYFEVGRNLLKRPAGGLDLGIGARQVAAHTALGKSPRKIHGTSPVMAGPLYRNRVAAEPRIGNQSDKKWKQTSKIMHA